MDTLCACGRPLETVNDFKHQSCFRCKIQAVAFDFSGVQDRVYGEGLTNRETQERTVEDAARMGVAAEPVGARWV